MKADSNSNVVAGAGGGSNGQSKPKPRSSFGRLRNWFFRLCLVLLLLLLVAGASAWFARDWLVAKAEAALLAKLEERGTHISYEKIEWQVLRGLVMHDFFLWEDQQRTIPLIKLGDVAFRPWLRHLAKKRELQGRLSIKDTTLSLFHDGESVADIEALTFGAHLQPSGMVVRQLDGLIFGMRLDAKGFLRLSGRDKDDEKPAGDDTEDADNDKPLDFSHFIDIAKWFTLESATSTPSLAVVFNIDRQADDPIIIDARLEGSDVTWRGLPLEHLHLDGSYSEAARRLDMSRIVLGHRGGRLEGALKFHMEQRALEITQVHTTLNIPAFLADLPFNVERVVEMVSIETEHPELRIDGVMELADMGRSSFATEIVKPLSLTLDVGGEDPVAFDRVHGKLNFDKKNLLAENLAFTLFGLDVNANGRFKLPERRKKPETVEADNPEERPAAPSDKGEDAGAPGANEVEEKSGEEKERAPEDSRQLESKTARFFAALEKWISFAGEGDKPLLDATFVVNAGAADPVAIGGKLSGGEFTWQGVKFDAADIDFRYSLAGKTIDVPQFQLVYGGEPIRGGVAYHIGARRLVLDKVQCDADWVALADGLPFGFGDALSGGEFPDPPELSIDGKLDFNDYHASDFTLAWPRSVPVNITAGERVIGISGFRGTVHVSGGGFTTEDSEILLGDGSLNWNGVFVPDSLAYDGTVLLENMPLAELLALAGREPVPGIINGRVTANGDREVIMWEGDGDIAVTETEALNVPIMGRMLRVLARIAPVFGSASKETLTMTFATSEGIMETDDLVVRGSGFLVEAEGSIDWNRQTTKFTATANFDGVLQLITAVASRVLVIEGEGPLGGVQWRFRNLDTGKLTGAVRSLFGAGGVFLGVGGEGGRRLGEGMHRVGEGATEGVRRVGQGVRRGGQGVGEGLMRLLPGTGRRNRSRESDPEPKPSPAPEPE